MKELKEFLCWLFYGHDFRTFHSIPDTTLLTLNRVELCIFCKRHRYILGEVKLQSLSKMYSPRIASIIIGDLQETSQVAELFHATSNPDSRPQD